MYFVYMYDVYLLEIEQNKILFSWLNKIGALYIRVQRNNTLKKIIKFYSFKNRFDQTQGQNEMTQRNLVTAYWYVILKT